MMKKWQSIIAAAVFSAFWAIPASAESYGCADGTSSCHTNSGSTGRVSNGGTSGSSGSPSSLGASSSGGATSPDPHLFGCGASPLCSGQSSASADQNVIIASNGPYAANYGTWRSEYIGTKTANGKYASPSINIYSNTKNSLRCTGKINLEDDNGFMLPAAITTKIVPANASGTLVSAKVDPEIETAV